MLYICNTATKKINIMNGSALKDKLCDCHMFKDMVIPNHFQALYNVMQLQTCMCAYLATS